MKIIKLTLMALTLSLATMQPIMYAMENSQKPQVAQQENKLLNDEKQQRELFRGARQIMETHDRQKAMYQERKLNYLQNVSKELGKSDINLLRDRMTDKFEDKARTKRRKINHIIFKNSPKVNQNDQDKRTPYNDEKSIVHEPMEKEITTSIPAVQIESRSSILKNCEKATIQTLPDLNENSLNDSIPEVKVENCSVLTENAAALPTSQLAESNSSLSDSQLEDFPIPVNLINQATSNASNNAIVTDKLGVNDDASSTINSNNSEDEAHNQLTEKRNKQIVKIAPLLIQKFNEDNAQPISVQKELTQEEIIARAHAMATTLEQSVDIFLIDVYDKYKSSIKTFKETTKEERQLFGTKSFFSSKAAPNDKFEIKDFIDKHRVDLLLCNQIKNCGLRITDPVEKMKLKNRLGIIANKSSYNCRLMETLLNSFIQKKQHQTATIISYDINMNKEESGQLFFDKIAPIIKKGNSDLRTGYWTSTKNCPQAQERSNNDFALENSIAFPQAEKYLLDQLPEHIKKTQATLATALTNAKIGF